MQGIADARAEAVTRIRQQDVRIVRIKHINHERYEIERRFAGIWIRAGRADSLEVAQARAQETAEFVWRTEQPIHREVVG